jgi:hypothetical protein
MQLQRESISKLPIQTITVEIAALQRMADFYTDYIERKGEYSYVDERLNYLYGRMAEYMIARELHIDNIK